MTYTTARIRKKNSTALLKLRKDKESMDDVLTRILGTNEDGTYTVLDNLKRSLDLKAQHRREADLKEHLARLVKDAEAIDQRAELGDVFKKSQARRRGR